ncbi:MAG: hypothetical protein ABEK04_00160 [Candidatus Nanohalobium sp.]
MNPKNWLNEIKEGFKAAFESRKKALTTISISSFTFVLLALSSFPTYSIQMFSSGFEYWIPAIQARVTGAYIAGGSSRIAIMSVYGLLTGIALTNFFTQLRNSGAEVKGLSGIIPGFIAAGCAGCGVGLLGFMGLTGALAAMPLQGNLVRVGGLGLLFYYIGKTGNPRICTIPDE